MKRRQFIRGVVNNPNVILITLLSIDVWGRYLGTWQNCLIKNNAGTENDSLQHWYKYFY